MKAMEVHSVALSKQGGDLVYFTIPEFKSPNFHLFKALLPCCNEKVTFRGYDSSVCGFQCSSGGSVCTQFDFSNKHVSVFQGYIDNYLCSWAFFLSQHGLK